MCKTWGFFLVAQDMVLSHRAKFQLIINFFRVKAISTGLHVTNITKAVYELRYLTYTYIHYVMLPTIYSMFCSKALCQKASILHTDKPFILDHLLD